MSWMRRLLNSGPRRADIERELADEVAFHPDQQVADLESDGWAPDAARREAHRRVGLAGTWVAGPGSASRFPHHDDIDAGSQLILAAAHIPNECRRCAASGPSPMSCS